MAHFPRVGLLNRGSGGITANSAITSCSIAWTAKAGLVPKCRHSGRDLDSTLEVQRCSRITGKTESNPNHRPFKSIR